MPTPLHFGFFSSFMPPAWHAPKDRLFGDDWASGAFHARLAERAERACFDFLFLEDTSGVSRKLGGNTDFDLRYALSAPKNDPVALISYLSAVTERIGLISTASTTLYPPFLLARVFATIDNLSNGRAGWNIVTSSEDEAAQNYGLDALPPTNERYDRADEFVDLARKLWDSWEPDAVVKDVDANIYTDPTKVHAIEHEGPHFKVRGPLNSYPSPQRTPVLAQAGGSPRGRAFAAKHAELIMATTIGGVEAMTEFREDIHARMRAIGRDPRECRIMYAMHPYITESVESMRSSITDAQLTPVLGKHGAHLGVDLLSFDLNEPFPDDVVSHGTTSMLESLKAKGRQGVTLREAIIDFNWGEDELGVVGPANQVAKNMVAAMEAAGGDGYIIMATQDASPQVIDGIIDELVPALKGLGAMRTDYSGTTLRDNLFAF